MTAAQPVLISAPGAGLGHLMRASTLALALRKIGVGSRIVTHSRFAKGLRRLTGLAIDHIPGADWADSAADYARTVRSELVVLDVFPWGIRGEWKEAQGLRYVTLARRLRVEAYLEAAGLTWRADSPHLRRVIPVEPLNLDYIRLLQDSGSEIRSLPGRVRFPADEFTPRDSHHPLHEILNNEPTWLVVHSGPPAEVDALLTVAKKDRGDPQNGSIILIRPERYDTDGVPCLEYFPAAALHDRAFRVVTGGGYNSVAEMSLWPEKHLAVPFRRRYDDQEARLAEPGQSPINGDAAAAEAVAGWL